MARVSVKELRGKDLSGMSLKQLRAAYTAYRDVMVKNAKRLVKGTATQQEYARVLLDYENIHNPKGLKTLKMIDSFVRPGWTEETYRRDMLKRVQELQKLEQMPRYSLSGWKDIEKRTIEALQAANYDINAKNIKQFGAYMERLRSAFGNKVFPSDLAAEKFSETQGEVAKLDTDTLVSMINDLNIANGGVDLFA